MGEIALALLRKYWYAPVILLLALGCWHFDRAAVKWHDSYTVSEAARKTDRDAFNEAAKQAAAKNQQEVQQKESEWKKVVTDNEQAYSKKLDDAYASVRSYADRMRNQAAATTKGGTSTVSVSNSSGTPGSTEGTSASTLVPATLDDLNICAENTVKAQSWLDFYSGLQQKEKQ